MPNPEVHEVDEGWTQAVLPAGQLQHRQAPPPPRTTAGITFASHDRSADSGVRVAQFCRSAEGGATLTPGASWT